MPTFLLFPAWTLLAAAAVTAGVGAATGHRPGSTFGVLALAMGVGAVAISGTAAPLLPCLLATGAMVSVIIGGQLRGWPTLVALIAAQPFNLAWRAPSGDIQRHDVQVVHNDARWVLWQDLCLADVDEREARDWAGRYGLVESKAPTTSIEWSGERRRLAWSRGADEACMHSEHGLWPLGG